MEREGDRQYMMMQNVENDRFMERRMLDFMKIYDRQPLHSGMDQHRKIKTEVDEHFNPEVNSYRE